MDADHRIEISTSTTKISVKVSAPLPSWRVSYADPPRMVVHKGTNVGFWWRKAAKNGRDWRQT